MDIWEILDIAPTTDKKSIKKAYAQRSRVIHPEEKPDEFRILYEAYQAALKYADLSSKRNRDMDAKESPVTETADIFVDEQSMGSPELISYFIENQEKQQQRVDAFLQYWEKAESPYRDPEMCLWWKEYLASEDFQNIRRNQQVLHLLAEEIDNKFFYGIDEWKMLFWDAYGFKKDGETEYTGDLQKLWRCLYPAYTNHQRILKERQRQEKAEKWKRFFMIMPAVSVVVLCIIISLNVHNKRENERRYLVQYMTEQYPATEFSDPERSGKTDYGTIIYTFSTSAHPEITVTATVEYQYWEGERAYLVTEDYGLQLLEYYADQYGLQCGRIEYRQPQQNYEKRETRSVLVYADIERADVFCETVEKMFREQNELQILPPVGICAKNVIFPEVLLQGGADVDYFPFSEPQFYELQTMKADELESLIREVYMVYMFHYESWNLTAEQYREWGTTYENLCTKWDDGNGSWYDMLNPDTGEKLCTLYIPTYEVLDGAYSTTGLSAPIYTQKMTVGSAYYFLLERGADLSVEEDGSGFTVEFYGRSKTFGRDPEVEFNELRKWY